MKRTLLLLVLVASYGAASAQCTPNPLYTDSVFGVWPDTTTDFRSGIINQFYSDTLNMLIPLSATDISEDYPDIQIDSIQLVSLSGLPPGLTIACNSQTPAACSYLPQQLGCGLIEGTPTATGTFDININVLAWFTFFGPQSLPQEFTGYSITITDSNVGLSSTPAQALSNVRSVPNPFSSRTNIEFGLSTAGPVQVRVYNMVGEEVWMHRMDGKLGQNKVPFEGGDLPAGVYLYKVESGSGTFTGRMALQR
ncbi:MAG: T9SS type A sorting domain-containing protein [Flavobacteriales bacterium]